MAAVKEAEEDLATKERREGSNVATLARANDETLASLRLLDSGVDRVPGIDDTMIKNVTIPEPQNGLLRAFWTMRETHFIQTKEYEFAKKLVEVLRKDALEKAEKTPAWGPKGDKHRKNLDFKTIGHLKDSKFAGKDGGSGWTNFLEDFSVVLSSVDRDLEKAVKKVMETKEKLESKEDVEELLGSWVEEPRMEEVYTTYSGELFARLMEIKRRCTTYGTQ